jgi:hypothetical protein
VGRSHRSDDDDNIHNIGNYQVWSCEDYQHPISLAIYGIVVGTYIIQYINVGGQYSCLQDVAGLSAITV